MHTPFVHINYIINETAYLKFLILFSSLLNDYNGFPFETAASIYLFPPLSRWMLSKGCSVRRKNLFHAVDDAGISILQSLFRSIEDVPLLKEKLQAGIHPSYTGATYLEICRAVKAEAPGMHVHAFSPLEVWQGAKTLGVPLRDYLAQLKNAGLGTLPGTAAEILDDEVRQVICHDKVSTEEWLEVMRSAHGLGLRSTSTIMFGHMML